MSLIYEGKWLISSMTRLLKDVYDRNSRREMFPSESFVIPGVRDGESILHSIPFVINFKDRLAVFEKEAQVERLRYQVPGEPANIRIKVRRTQVFIDGDVTFIICCGLTAFIF